MNGAHDMGGMQSFGPVNTADDGRAFHAAWEGRTFAMSMILPSQGVYNINQYRYARERIPPPQYLASSYFELWLTAMERLVVESGLAAPAELAAHARDPRLTQPTPAQAPRDLTQRMLRKVHEGLPALREDGPRPSFASGDRVRASTANPRGHTRLPRYARGKRGVVDLVHGSFELPDASAAGRSVPEPLYTVRFEATELWGEQAAAGDGVRIDLWESYLKREEDGP
ncbi:MAG: nitrile hydratase subunit beta [Candidatus Dormibacteraceae bacterium]